MPEKPTCRKDDELVHHLTLLTCECGAKILLFPDLRVMNRAIEAHVSEHRKKEKDPGNAALTAVRIREMLIKQLLKKVSEINK
jgi:hypothetical protein